MKLKSEGAGCFENKSLSGICRRKGPKMDARWDLLSFWEKKVSSRILDQKGPEMVFFQVLRKSNNTWRYSDFLHEVAVAKRLKTDLNIFMANIL